METGETISILNSWITLIADQRINCLKHILGNSFVEWAILSDILMLLRIWIGTIVQESLDHSLVLILNGKMEWCLAVHIFAVDVNLTII